MKTLLFFGLALATACTAFAVPTITGPTGGFEVPTADIARGVQVAVDQPTDAYNIKYPNIRLLVRAVPNLEVGGQYIQETLYTLGPYGSIGSDLDFWNVNAKYALPTPEKSIKLAIGGNIGETLGTPFPDVLFPMHELNAYLAATTTIGENVKATANLGYTHQSVGYVNLDGLTFGMAVEKPISRNTLLGAEFLLGNKSGGTTHGNLYLTSAVNDKLATRIAVSAIGQSTEIMLGANYTFNNERDDKVVNEHNIIDLAHSSTIPTITGPTGGFEIPTADIVEGVQVAVDQPSYVFDYQRIPNTRALIGILPNLEVGARYEEQGLGYDGITPTYGVNAKYRFPIKRKYINISVGGEYSRKSYPDDFPAIERWDAYLAATTRIADVKATAKAGFHSYSDPNISVPWESTFREQYWIYGISAEKPVNAKTTVGAEYLFSNDSWFFSAHANLYAAVDVTNNLKTRVALAGIGHITELYLGATYTFGK